MNHSRNVGVIRLYVILLFGHIIHRQCRDAGFYLNGNADRQAYKKDVEIIKNEKPIYRQIFVKPLYYEMIYFCSKGVIHIFKPQSDIKN